MADDETAVNPLDTPREDSVGACLICGHLTGEEVLDDGMVLCAVPGGRSCRERLARQREALGVAP